MPKRVRDKTRKTDPAKELERLLSKAAPPNEKGCRIWQCAHKGHSEEHQYGTHFMWGQYWRAHRAAYLLAVGEPGDSEVCHKCDVTLCVEPSHLFLGTHRDNMVDMTAKKRNYIARGESSGRALITDDDVRVIRSLAGVVDAREIAARFGINRSTVYGIINGRRWGHVVEKPACNGVEPDRDQPPVCALCPEDV